jgi:adenylate kinase
MDNYKTIIKQQMHTMRIEENSYSNYEDRMLNEYEKEKLEKNKKELRDNLKKP